MIPSFTLILLVLQAVISVKPGFVDVVDGKANVRLYEHLDAGKRVQTEAGGHVEIRLDTDAVLRLDENTTAVLESLSREDVAVRIESGEALLEVSEIEKPDRIRIDAGGVSALVDSSGIFRFSERSVSVIEGKLKIADGAITVQKDWQVQNNAGRYEQTKLENTTPSLFKSFMNSPRVGFVNAVYGQANVRETEIARSDQEIQTGPSSFVELLLRPGSFMRIDENSSVVIESTDLNDTVVRVASGSMLIDSVVADDRLFLRVNLGGSKTVIAGSGLYRFTSDTATVIDGSLQIGKKGETASDRTEVRFADNMYDTREIEDEIKPDGLDLWSAERSQQLSRANFLADYGDVLPNFFLYVSPRPYSAAWIYSPSLKGFTFIPQSKRESHYGNSFVPLYTLIPRASPRLDFPTLASYPKPPLPSATRRPAPAEPAH